MTSTPDNPEEYGEEDLVKWLDSIPNGTIYAYNLDHTKTPGGLKVRWKIRVATGPQATRWEQKTGRRDQGDPGMAHPAPLKGVTSSNGPAEPVPVAFLGRTSTLLMQDPRASLQRQLREVKGKLPPGWYIAAHYWDIEVRHEVALCE